MIQDEPVPLFFDGSSMRCQNCSAENPEGAKFCIECAAPIKRQCPQCNFDNPAAAKFCAQCATPLRAAAIRQPLKAGAPNSAGIGVTLDSAAPAALDGERKTVTALFADIKGSTELEQDLDPEEARAIVDPALKLMIDAVHRYDGYVVQIDRRRHLRAVRCPGRARGPSAARALFGAPDAGGAAALLREAGRRRWQPAARQASVSTQAKL